MESPNVNLETLQEAERILEKFKNSLILRYVSADNSIVDVQIFRGSSTMPGTLTIAFRLNYTDVLVKVPDISMTKFRDPKRFIQDLEHKVAKALTREFLKHTKLTELIVEKL